MILRASLAALLIAAPPLAGQAGKADSGFAPVDHGRLYYESRGTGPALVLIHGGNMDRRMWDPQFREFSAKYRVIRYDVRNFGRSTETSGKYASHEDLYRLLQFLHIDRANLVGLSLGGRIAVDFALQHPEMVNRLVLAGPGLSGYRFTALPREKTEAMQRAVAARDSEAVTQWWLTTGYMIPAMEHAELREQLHQLARANARAWFSNDEETLSPPALGRLQEIKVPVLIILGERDVPDIHNICDSLTAKIPQARLERVPKSGHIVNLEAPEVFNRLVSEFLAK